MTVEEGSPRRPGARLRRVLRVIIFVVKPVVISCTLHHLLTRH